MTEENTAIKKNLKVMYDRKQPHQLEYKRGCGNDISIMSEFFFLFSDTLLKDSMHAR